MAKTQQIGNAYINLARTVPALNDPLKTRRVASIREFLKTVTVPPPFCLWVWDSEAYEPEQGIREEGAVQETEQVWSAYLGVASFGPAGEGAFEQAAGAAEGEDAETLAELLVAAIQGELVYADADAVSRAFPVVAGLYDVTEHAAIYRVRFRNPFIRHSV